SALVGADQYHCRLRHDDFPPSAKGMIGKHPPHGGTKEWRNRSEDVEFVRNPAKIKAAKASGGRLIPPMSNTVMKVLS
ncbi:MAG TPA: hypothetical protein VG291_03740, partial [Xanthobacteraceae bacterium]|nr:hypothetical protein [Xanthobacteraceae bacterium]